MGGDEEAETEEKVTNFFCGLGGDGPGRSVWLWAGSGAPSALRVKEGGLEKAFHVFGATAKTTHSVLIRRS